MAPNNDIDNDDELNLGRLGEAVLETKAANAVSIATISTLLLGFTFLSSPETKGSFTDEAVGSVAWTTSQKAQVVSAALSTGCGIGCVLQFSMLSVKINRLVARSNWRYGNEGTLKDLQKIKKDKANKHHEVNKENDKVEFCARKWFNEKVFGEKRGKRGVWSFNAGFYAFLLQVVSFLASAACQMYDETSDEKLVQILSLVFMLVWPIIVLLFLLTTDHFSALD